MYAVCVPTARVPLFTDCQAACQLLPHMCSDWWHARCRWWMQVDLVKGQGKQQVRPSV